MKIRNRQITKLLLLIPGLVILAHLFIPHDHHFDFHTDLLHHHHSEQRNSGEEPMHCHYFNNIDFNKVRTDNLAQIIQQIPVLYSLSSSLIFDLDVSCQQGKFITFKDNLPDYSVFVFVSPTRGSPLA